MKKYLSILAMVSPLFGFQAHAVNSCVQNFEPAMGGVPSSLSEIPNAVISAPDMVFQKYILEQLRLSVGEVPTSHQLIIAGMIRSSLLSALSNHHVAFPAFQKLMSWKAGETVSVDLLVYKSRLQEIASGPLSTHFKGDASDVLKVLHDASNRTLQFKNPQVIEESGTYRVRVQIQSQEQLFTVANALANSMIGLVGLEASTSVKTESLLVHLPDAEVARLVPGFPTGVGSYLSMLATNGRISVEALKAAISNTGSPMKFKLVVFKEVLGALKERNPQVFRADASDVARLFSNTGLTPKLKEESQSTLTFEVEVKSTQELETLMSRATFGAVLPAVMI